MIFIRKLNDFYFFLKFKSFFNRKCIGIIQRILSFQKRTRTRLSYSWRPLWNGRQQKKTYLSSNLKSNLALISLLKFLQNCESQLTKHRDLFQLASKVINIFNLFITFGDTFLRTPEAYDEVFYETVRCYHVFDNLFAFGKNNKYFRGVFFFY